MIRADNLARQRANIYRWFACMLFQELSVTDIASLNSPELQQLLRGLKSIPELRLSTDLFRNKIKALINRPDNHLELAADYAELFLMPPPTGVSPYAGHYPHSSPAEERLLMSQWLKHVKQQTGNNEAADHLAVQLAVMALLIESHHDQPSDFISQHEYLRDRLLSWLPGLVKLCVLAHMPRYDVVTDVHYTMALSP
ncbi:molecular chaperone TorD family protein [Jinshanibacter sp. LJY008]|uniref:Molecular chaperone TorD family protein n=1 Tax=Limnobaculum eriocheiris TaxID=2897391 RepID=A0A9X1SKE4_9GAMM|nr:molecular chaperone TorD family protein [Limnobaculum eriocheiris]MCD1125224.1 molecular chaperone TorD family protein [Limnobaculum eriocheiris]